MTFQVIAEIGRRRDSFSGTDALPMGVITEAEVLVSSGLYPTMCAEGDRLANDRFFDSVSHAGYELVVVLLDVPDEIAQARRDERGSSQNPSWIKGRVTKTQRLASRWAKHTLDGREPVDILAEQLRPILEGR